MLLQISKSFTNYLLKKEIIEYSKKELIIYGFQLTLSTFASMVTILTLSYFFNILYGFIFLCLYAFMLVVIMHKPIDNAISTQIHVFWVL